jgi:hypothetical protein
MVASANDGVEIKDELSRLLNAIASFRVGRDYLLSVGQGQNLSFYLRYLF